MKRYERIVAALRTLAHETRRGRYDAAPVHRLVEATPFQILAGCLVSQRARDERTTVICAALFALAPTPEALLRLRRPRLERILRPGGFQRVKAARLVALARAVVQRGGVPRTRGELTALPGIGPKCANIVLASAFGAPAIAVDTHVHRISNRMGWVRTRTPEQTEAALTPRVPVRWRRRVNALLVAHGQLVCTPLAPRCGECAIAGRCPRIGVEPQRSRTSRYLVQVPSLVEERQDRHGVARRCDTRAGRASGAARARSSCRSAPVPARGVRARGWSPGSQPEPATWRGAARRSRSSPRRRTRRSPRGRGPPTPTRRCGTEP